MMKRPAFQITIDTEGDNLWARPASVTTRNAAYLPRFQHLCEKYGLKPTYLVNWEMANSPVFQELGRDVIKRGVAEIGMHLHAWDSPPIVPLTANDSAQHPYLIEFPETTMREKVKVITGRLEDIFQVKMESHRAGRWAFNKTYARILADSGYLVDCSVTPHVSWKRVKGAVHGDGGSNYTHHPDGPFWYDFGSARILELPVSILRQSPPILMRGVRFLLQKRTHKTIWLRPNGSNLSGMLEVLREALCRGRSYVQFVLHSSELMPGGSPSFDNQQKIELLYGQLEVLFQRASNDFRGQTLSEFARAYAQYSPPAVDAPDENRAATA
jgi:hypothetical protein